MKNNSLDVDTKLGVNLCVSSVLSLCPNHIMDACMDGWRDGAFLYLSSLNDPTSGWKNVEEESKTKFNAAEVMFIVIDEDMSFFQAVVREEARNTFYKAPL